MKAAKATSICGCLTLRRDGGRGGETKDDMRASALARIYDQYIDHKGPGVASERKGNSAEDDYG